MLVAYEHFIVFCWVQNLMSIPKTTVSFSFIDPTDALCRLIMLGPLAANEKNMSFSPRDSLYYEDFADGERLRRITEELPAGTAALSSVLFFDEINLDQKGYTTGDGVLIMGSFFNRRARESLFSKYALGTLPSVAVARVNQKRVVYLRFCRELRASCHATILRCYTNFNNAGGAMLRLQYDDRLLYFPRAVILAVYANFPAGIVCSS
jgi:hypothetical protein